MGNLCNKVDNRIEEKNSGIKPPKVKASSCFKYKKTPSVRLNPDERPTRKLRLIEADSSPLLHNQIPAKQSIDKNDQNSNTLRMIEAGSSYHKDEFNSVIQRPPMKFQRQPRSISGQSGLSGVSQTRRFLRRQESDFASINLENSRASVLDGIESSVIRGSDQSTPIDSTFCQISLNDQRSIMHSLVSIKRMGHQLKRLLADENITGSQTLPTNSGDYSSMTPVSLKSFNSATLTIGSPTQMAGFFAENMTYLEDLSSEQLREKIEQLSQLNINLVREIDRKNAHIKDLESRLRQ